MLKIRFLFVLFFMLLSYVSFAQVLENYDGQWESAKEESWLGSNNQIELKLNLNSFPKSALQIRLPAESTVFIDQKLWLLSTLDTVIYRGVEELRSEFEKDTVTFTLVSPNLSKMYGSVKKVVGADLQNELAQPSGEILSGQRFVLQPVKDFFFTGLVLILFFMALYKMAYPYMLGLMLQPLAVISAEDFSDSGNLQKFFSVDVLFFLFIVGMMISEASVLCLVVFKKDWLETWIGLDYSSLVLIWLLGAFGVLFLTIVKFMGIRVISYLFDLGKAEFSHFFYLLRLIVFGSTLLILFGTYFVFNDYQGLESVFYILISGLFWGYIIGVLGLFLIMMNRLSFKKYHLFTYLCIAELIPFLILSKWILDLGQ
ncbi:DUF4271 domain-containing protein [Algoriphagus boritolerans]|uniref:DUF4271 domain-containing protein n=1 Tax=Algoriphagus boritolerans DSM 17298 = JCM 18970 TaxID=1120964 RepID=A0A1H5W186_9BACT|nr:DUF4271 domain-containing protein [Algoriphagus boritolerans]SEF93299.1 protein of unknown function [Algoriphagus boritolerans DSM 17298 = JCM 18970]